IRGDRAGSPIEADQYRMYCEAGPVKIRLAARAVPDLDPGPLAREHRPQPPAVPLRPCQNSLFLKSRQALVFTTLLEFTASHCHQSRVRPSIQKSAGGVKRLRGGS
ncbi:MAG: hypothetical protein WBM36_14745, partial [Lysobacterales bacterium]